MVTDRPYRAALTVGVAIAELRRCSGSQFDPEVVEALSSVVADRDDDATVPPAVEVLA
jgi:HD-GYP domain-containing protein (c-di-GMP phosphodiesterase class II)